MLDTPVAHEELTALVDLGTLLIGAGAPAAKYGVALLMRALNGGLAEADTAFVRGSLVKATLACLATSPELLSSPQWLPVLCKALSQPALQPADRSACETMLKHWIQAWCNDEVTYVEPSLVAEELRQVLVAQVGMQRTAEEDATLVFFVEELFKGALKRKASTEAEWALRAFQQWTGPAARQAFARCISQMPIARHSRASGSWTGCAAEGAQTSSLRAPSMKTRPSSS